MGGCSRCWETPGRQARSQGQAPRGRRRTPVSAVLAGPSSGPPSQIPEGCGFRSSPTLRPRPGPSCRPGASSLLITLSLPLFRVYQLSSSSPLSSCLRPPPIPPLLDHCQSLPSGLPFAPSLQTVIHLAPKLSRIYQKKSLLYNTLCKLPARSV